MAAKTSKSMVIAEQLMEAIKDGQYGKSGDRFMPVRALSKEMGISLVTAQKVLNLVKQHGFLILYGNRYYLTSGGLSTESPLYQIMQTDLRTNFRHEYPLIGIHIIDINNPFFSSLVKETMELIRKRLYMPIIMCSNNDPMEERKVLREFIAMGVKGIISCPNHDNSLYHVYENYILPVVYMAHQFTKTDIDSVLVNDTMAANRVASHLLEMGYRDFMYIGINVTAEEDYRQSGFINGLASEGYSMPSDNVFCLPISDDFNIPYFLQRKILKAQKPLGIFCYHDMIAIQVLITCKRLGINVPQDVGVIGFDDLPIATQYDPDLTTIAYRYDRMAESAVNLLIDRIQSEKSTRNGVVHYINPVLKIRQSTRR